MRTTIATALIAVAAIAAATIPILNGHGKEVFGLGLLAALVWWLK